MFAENAEEDVIDVDVEEKPSTLSIAEKLAKQLKSK